MRLRIITRQKEEDRHGHMTIGDKSDDLKFKETSLWTSRVRLNVCSFLKGSLAWRRTLKKG